MPDMNRALFENSLFPEPAAAAVEQGKGAEDIVDLYACDSKLVVVEKPLLDESLYLSIKQGKLKSGVRPVWNSALLGHGF